VHRTQLCQQLPALQGVSQGSHAWCFIEHSRLNELDAKVLDAFLDPTLVAPAHPAASRIVTSHCDLHAQNMLKTNGQAKCIDLESACVTYAVFDLALGMGLASFSGDMGNRQILIQSYLEALGHQYKPGDEEELIFEAEMARACYLHGVLQPSRLTLCPETAIGLISAMTDFVSRARSSASLRAEIVRLGFRRCAELDASLAAAEKVHTEAQTKRSAEIVEGGTCNNKNQEEVSSSPSGDSWNWLGLSLGLPVFPIA
jgi:Ser/Thr protein kinase RdoA (MazF antagonist)